MKSNDRLKVVATLETHIVLRCVFQFSGVVIGIIHAYFHAPNKWIYVAISTLWLKTVMFRNLPHCFLLTCFSNTCFLPMAYSWNLCVSCNACSGKQRCSTSWRFETVGGPHVCAPCGESNQVCLATRKRCASACIAEQATQGSAAQAFLHRWTSIFATLNKRIQAMQDTLDLGRVLKKHSVAFEITSWNTAKCPTRCTIACDFIGYHHWYHPLYNGNTARCEKRTLQTGSSWFSLNVHGGSRIYHIASYSHMVKSGVRRFFGRWALWKDFHGRVLNEGIQVPPWLSGLLWIIFGCFGGL